MCFVHGCVIEYDDNDHKDIGRRNWEPKGAWGNVMLMCICLNRSGNSGLAKKGWRESQGKACNFETLCNDLMSVCLATSCPNGHL